MTTPVSQPVPHLGDRIDRVPRLSEAEILGAARNFRHERRLLECSRLEYQRLDDLRMFGEYRPDIRRGSDDESDPLNNMVIVNDNYDLPGSLVAHTEEGIIPYEDLDPSVFEEDADPEENPLPPQHSAYIIQEVIDSAENQGLQFLNRLNLRQLRQIARRIAGPFSNLPANPTVQQVIDFVSPHRRDPIVPNEPVDTQTRTPGPSPGLNQFPDLIEYTPRTESSTPHRGRPYLAPYLIDLGLSGVEREGDPYDTPDDSVDEDPLTDEDDDDDDDESEEVNVNEG